MFIFKLIMLVLIFGICSYIGILISNKYINREKDLYEFKTALNMFLTKIQFTYEPIPEIFRQLSKKLKPNIGNIFHNASCYMNDMPAGEAWNKALTNSNTNLNKEDINVLKNLSNLLGKVDINGQVGEINLVDKFVDKQIETAKQDKNKYSKMYKSLGITIGLALVIILF